MSHTAESQSTPFNKETPRLSEESLLEVNTELLMHDPSLLTVSLRRHGKYERSPSSPQRGQLTKETFPEVKEKAKAWVEELPEELEIDLFASPTGMPATGPSGKSINPARARMSSALYGIELRNRFGSGYGLIDKEEISDRNTEFTKETRKPPKSVRKTERRLGDIYEFCGSKEQAQHIPTFFKMLGDTYGGLNKDFWHDYTRDELPEDLKAIFLQGGGQLAVKKAKNVSDWLSELSDSKPEDEVKHVTLAISHEETIGPFAYRVAQFLKETGGANSEEIDQIENKSFSYNEGFDLHIDDDKDVVMEVDDIRVVFNLGEFGEYLEKQVQS